MVDLKGLKEENSPEYNPSSPIYLAEYGETFDPDFIWDGGLNKDGKEYYKMVLDSRKESTQGDESISSPSNDQIMKDVN